MISLDKLTPKLQRAWRWLRAPTWLGLGLALGFGIPYAIYLDHLVREQFATLTFAQPSRVYARALELAPGARLTEDALLRELEAARYRETPDAIQPGTYARDGAKFTLSTRAFRGAHGAEPARRFVVTIRQGRVATLAEAGRGTKLERAFVDPARIATLYGPKQEERRIVRAQDVPPLLIATLQAVEDRDFKHHIGINPMAIVRAAWVNLTAGEVVQGGSTLTQQLVRNLFLSRAQTLWRKANEAFLALMIEARYPKQRILEAYLNEVYLGQQGAQAVHGFAAASEFYFGRELNALAPQEIALLVGMVQGPSLYDPRRFPERARGRREVVLKVMQDTGLINAMDRAAAAKAPLAVSSRGALPRNRYPAFVELVRTQIRNEFPDASLATDGLAILTTLSPSAQHYAEAAVAERMKAIGKNAAKLEAAVVVTHAQTGAVEAFVGGRDPDKPGFNRALNAARPIGSLVKPFVYLVALAQPQKYSLVSQLEDRAIGLKLPNGKVWKPANVDQVEHGQVALIDALARSYNLATVRLGLEVDVRKVARVLEALIPGAAVPPHPSLLLGAVDLSPYQVAQAYQYLASDGRPQPLTAVAAVLDANGRSLTRYEHVPAQGELVAASRLVGFALQEAARSGTARTLGGLGLGHLSVAGKTGTSNDQRDSWFAGYTGSHLGVVWIGADDNTQTGLYGATGSLRIWAALFAKLPTTPLKLEVGEDPQLAWVDPRLGRSVDAHCAGARQVPFVRGYEPVGIEDCGDWRVSGWFDGDEERYERYERYDGDDAEERAYMEAMRERELRRIEEEREARERPRRRRFRDWFRRGDDDED
ncbi:MAG TPA: penicillin-binding protein 1B [Xanthomonadales bacterium]|nr:penicillin-binding protein 1B [Xanthomonadales bacterium]